MAIIASSHAPLLILDADLNIVAASTSFSHVCQIDSADLVGRPLGRLGAGEWNMPRLSSLLRIAASGCAQVKGYEFELKHERGTRHLVLDANRLDHMGAPQRWLLMTVSDVTEARRAQRLRDELLAEKTTLLQELQHRIANSLQILASVLIQSARKTRSEETRSHLHQAHGRVMSVAALQRQLAPSGNDRVELRAYFFALCQSLEAATIHDPGRLSLEVRSDECVTSAAVCMSMGLVVTELVINAVKHGFPGNRRGKIVVEYRSDGTAWILSVSDNGVGKDKNPAGVGAGLGTAIVESLARQLRARIRIADAYPRTVVGILHPESTMDECADGSPTALAI